MVDQRQVNLDELLADFARWQKKTSEKCKETFVLQEEINLLKKQSDDFDQRENELKNEMTMLQDMISTLQGTLAKRCDYEESNRKLKDSLKEVQDKILDNEKVHNAEMEKVENQIVNLKRIHEDEVKETMEKNQNEAKKIEETFLKTISEKNLEIDALSKKIEVVEREKQSELIKLRLEYDAKLLKLQKQNSKAQTTLNSGANHDIFRKKLQHLRSESQQEISTLKRKIQELEQQGAQSSVPKNSRTPLFGSALSSKRSKKC